MGEFRLPWEEPEIKRVIDAFQCKVLSIEEAKEDDQEMDNQ